GWAGAGGRGGRAGALGVLFFLAEPALVAGLELNHPLDATPPLGPAPGLPDRVPDPLARRLEDPGGEEVVAAHAGGQLRRGVSPLPYCEGGDSTICEKRITVTVSSS